MRLKSLATILGIFSVASVLCFVAAGFAATLIEDTSELGVRNALDEAGHSWAEVESDGLQVTLFGTAPSEAQRFNALSSAAKVVDAARVIDEMGVQKPTELTTPRFSIELLRNDSGTSLIGLIPASTNRDDITTAVRQITGGTVTDLLQSADYPAPKNWGTALRYAQTALRVLPRSKISISADAVAIKAITESAGEKRRVEAELTRTIPDGLSVTLDITAPRPVITPFTLRMVIDADGARFDACTADTVAARDTILAAAQAAGITDGGKCTVGLGAPTADWADGAVKMINGLAEVGNGSITFSDADVSLLVAQGTDQTLFDTVVGKLENTLPEVFTLHAVLPEPEDDSAEGPPEFIATRSPEGQVHLTGRVRDELSRKTAQSVAHARFGSEAVQMSARLDDKLPQGWSMRVLAGLDALAQLNNGVISVTPDTFEVRGKTGKPEGRAQIAGLLSDKLGEGAQFDLDVTYDEALDPLANIPTPDECIAQINAANAANKITFDPGSSNVAAGSLTTVDAIAEQLKACPPFRLEIAGYTDSQGREGMNQTLSQERAQSVLNELMSRRVLVSGITAKGFGEQDPIADNGTEEGREANRRIEFRIIAEPAADADPDAATETGSDADANAAPEEPLESDAQPVAEQDPAPATEDAPANE